MVMENEKVLNDLKHDLMEIKHLLQGNQLDRSGSLINQVGEIKLDIELMRKQLDSDRKETNLTITDMKEKISINTEAILGKIATKVEKLEKFRDRAIWVAIGFAGSGGYAFKTLLDLWLKK